ncbi:hypothetical protein V8C26DRAFT_409653 [Trichoderma gracile]
MQPQQKASAALMPDILIIGLLLASLLDCLSSRESIKDPKSFLAREIKVRGDWDSVERRETSNHQCESRGKQSERLLDLGWASRRSLLL